MKIVLDTNVLVSGLLQPFGPLSPRAFIDLYRAHLGEDR
jgi:predicted nucleic acid-binding protein